jgi:trigger factor
MLSAVDLVGGAEAGDLVLKVTATSLPDLPAADFASLTLERLVPEESDPEAEAMARSHLKRQVLDNLEKEYDFPIAPLLVEREFAAIVKAADAQLDLDNEDRGQLEAEFRSIAERRIRLGVVVAETARRHGIQVSDEDVGVVRQAMTEQARAMESPAQTRGRSLEEKVIAWIVSRAQVRERRVTMDELAAL